MGVARGSGSWEWLVGVVMYMHTHTNSLHLLGLQNSQCLQQLPVTVEEKDHCVEGQGACHQGLGGCEVRVHMYTYMARERISYSLRIVFEG